MLVQEGQTQNPRRYGASDRLRGRIWASGRGRPLRALVATSFLVVAAGLVVTLQPEQASAASTTVLVSPSSDAYATKATPTGNHGQDTNLTIDSLSTDVKISYLRFDVSGIPVGAVIRTVTLQVTATNSTNTAAKVKSVGTGWTESTLTWNNRPPYTSSPAISSSPVNVVAGAVSFDVTSLVSGNGPAGIGLYQSGAASGDQVFSSKEGANPPRLAIVYDLGPSPSSPPPSSDPVVIAAGDIACDPSDPSYNGGLGTGKVCQQKATADVVQTLMGQSPIPSAVLSLGDQQYECGSLADFNAVYDPTWGRFKAITHPVPGNHEYKSSNPDAFGGTDCLKNAAGYYAYFANSAGDPSKGYYSFNLGSWHLIALNTSVGCGQVSCVQGAAQEQWLRADLTVNTQPCILAYWHQPRFSSKGDSTGTSAFWQDLYNFHADLVINGHIHGYERFAQMNPAGSPDPAGAREIIAGTGGEGPINFGTITRLGSEAKNGSTFGVLKLTLHPTSYDVVFVPVSGQTYTDSSTGTCH